MDLNDNISPMKNLKADLPASVVVFLVAMPLCLGIALASGAPLLSGLITGIIGGVIVGAISGSPLGVSGPAAGLAVIVLNAITDLGGFENFLVAVTLAGVLQLIMGYARAGIIAYFFPSSVIHGMLAGIGVIIFLKQIPHAFGYDKEPEGDLAFKHEDGHTTLDSLSEMWDKVSFGVLVIAMVSLAILILWEQGFMKKIKITRLIQAPLIVVILGTVMAQFFKGGDFEVSSNHFVQVPESKSLGDFIGNLKRPDFSALGRIDIYITAVIIAVVASLETLLCVEATDKQDPLKRVTPTNRELKAQGIGNILAGLVGGLPLTQVIVRSSANMQAGGRTKTSAIIHGVLLLVSVLAVPWALNMIPLGVLAAILFVVGYKLARPTLFKKMWHDGMGQFIPFIVTILGMVFTDLLTGIGLGMLVAIFVILRNNYQVPFTMMKENLVGKQDIKIELSEDVTFLNKASILKTLQEVPDNTSVIIDASKTKFIHFDVVEIIENFVISAESRGIEVELVELYDHKQEDPPEHFNVEADGKSIDLGEKE